jgi:hypothetical protein
MGHTEMIGMNACVGKCSYLRSTGKYGEMEAVDVGFEVLSSGM